MLEFIFGFICGIILLIVAAPFIIKKIIKIKINKMTGGLLDVLGNNVPDSGN